jgi:hypothetical protein
MKNKPKEILEIHDIRVQIYEETRHMTQQQP